MHDEPLSPLFFLMISLTPSRLFALPRLHLKTCSLSRKSRINYDSWKRRTRFPRISMWEMFLFAYSMPHLRESPPNLRYLPEFLRLDVTSKAVSYRRPVTQPGVTAFKRNQAVLLVSSAGELDSILCMTVQSNRVFFVIYFNHYNMLHST